MVRDKGCHVLYGYIYILWMRAFLNLVLHLLCIKQMLIVVACKGPSFRLMSFVDFINRSCMKSVDLNCNFNSLKKRDNLFKSAFSILFLPD